MTKQNSQAGIGHILVVALIVVVFSTIGFIGYKLYANPASKNATVPATSTTSALTAPTIKSSADLDTASGVLDQVDLNAANQSDISNLDSQLNAF
jgi:hypothetical protein